jgi:maleate cis-trans isomerase
MALGDGGGLDRRMIDRLLPRIRYGVIAPGTGGVQRGVDYQFYRLVPTDVMQIGVGLGVRDYSAASIGVAMDAFWSCVDTLVAEGAQSVMLSGVPVSAGLGRARILDLTQQVPNRVGVPFDATLEAIVRSLQFLGTTRITMASRFPDETNAAIADYLASAGVQVLATTARDLSLDQARQLSMYEGMQLALEVGREAARACPDAEAILVPGGATLSLHAIPALEAEFGKPALTNLSAEVWSALIRPGIVPPVDGWGALLSKRPQES